MTMRASIWAICLLVMAVFGGAQLVGGHTGIDADFLSLIGQEQTGDGTTPDDIHTVRDLLAQDGRQAIFMLFSPDRTKLETAGTHLANALSTLAGTSSITLPGQGADRLNELMDFYGPYAHGLLSDTDRETLQNGEGHRLYRRAVQNLYSPVTTLGSQTLQHDPFALLPAFLSGLGDKLGNGAGIIQRDGQFYLPLMVRLSPDLRQTGQDSIWVTGANDAINATLATAPGLKIAKTGQVFFAVAEATRAKSDVQRIAILATIGIVLMIGLVFYSPVPLIGALLVVGSGLIAGMAAVTLIFPAIHAIALVFGASLIGISVDYALHYLVMPPHSGTAQERIAKIRPGLSLGLLTSVIGFGALSVSPTQLLAQIAVYSVAGLIAAYISVLCLLPLIPCRKVQTSSPIHRFHHILQTGLAKTRTGFIARLCLAAAIFAGLMACLVVIPGNNDIRQLGHGNPALIQEAAQISDVMGIGGQPLFLQIRGQDGEARLQTAEAVRNALTPLLANGSLGGMIGLADVIPSIARQSENRKQVNDGLYRPFADQLSELLPVTVAAPDEKAPFLIFDDRAALNLPEITGLRLDGSDIIRLRAATGIDAITTAIAAIPDTHVIDPGATISAQFAQYRHWALIALGISLGVAGILAIVRYGLIRGICVFAAPAGAILIAVIGGHLIGISQNFFTTMALFLVFAIGADYVLFLAESRNSDHNNDTHLAVLLSLISSVLTFGLLASSSVPLVSDIGSVIAIGLVGAWFLAYWMTAPTIKNNKETPRDT
ncbi:MMPL family transporter [Thalassospira sp.]|uniref:MMPL family transporter n=1 Tax=Thalassospira sp. TaxID=1912094 RepID=UPI0027330420|nr:hypothetical protein [Thalassospira sp.]MDP2698559.1 hypothetical protein [Thalassospira sp.]